MKPLVALVADIREFDRYHWHVSPTQYIDAVADVSGVMPVIVPALAQRTDIDAVLSGVDGVVLTGSKTNVHPARYGETPGPQFEPYDIARDDTSIPVAQAAIERGIPLLAICRGIQELNVALGGTLAAEIQERDGAMDHRAPESDDQDVRFALAHDVALDKKGCLAPVFDPADTLTVNSLHRQAIATLAPGLRVEGTAPDGTIEAVSVRDARAFAIGVQWHPEYWAKSDRTSRALFEAFGEAVRRHRDARGDQNASKDMASVDGSTTS
jgi:putative glutamine amidotransferase